VRRRRQQKQMMRAMAAATPGRRCEHRQSPQPSGIDPSCERDRFPCRTKSLWASSMTTRS
jgi:hypothetical protein